MKQAERSGLHRWSRHEYGQMIDHSLLDEDDPIELLDGLLPEPDVCVVRGAGDWD
jgi:hypothetical protein